jgi:hypothetical protein
VLRLGSNVEIVTHRQYQPFTAGAYQMTPGVIIMVSGWWIFKQYLVTYLMPNGVHNSIWCGKSDLLELYE